MLKLFSILLCCFQLTKSYSQKEHKISIFLEGEFANTIYDKTSGNNPWGVGLGLQAYYNNNSTIQPTIEFSAATYLEDDKVLRLNPSGTAIDDINGMINLLAGASVHAGQSANFSLLVGPSFINSYTYFAIKPSLGFFFSNNQKLLVKISYINVFSRTKDPDTDFGSISVSLGIKLL